MPAFNDWTSCGVLLGRLDAALTESGLRAVVTVVDDASHARAPDDLVAASPHALDGVRVVRLARNLGHQRAICVGLADLAARSTAQFVVVMDSDGEDAAADVPRLVRKALDENGQRLVFAERTKRSESLYFRFGYHSYRLLHRALTGRGIRQGNFSVVPMQHVRALCLVPELWSHYAAAVGASGIPFCHVPTERAKRIDGRSTMNTVALVKHGMSAISVFSDVVGVRLLGFAALFAVLVPAVLLLAAGPLRGWLVGDRGSAAALVATLLLGVALLNAASIGVLLAFGALADRKGAVFIPKRDCAMFVADETVHHPRAT